MSYERIQVCMKCSCVISAAGLDHVHACYAMDNLMTSCSTHALHKLAHRGVEL